MRISIVTVSDRASRGEYEDLSGPEIERVLSRAHPEADIWREIVADDEAQIIAALDRAAAAGADWILTSGGTGPSPRDRTPEATSSWIDREMPGIAEALRALSLKETPFAVFSRAIAGMRGPAFVVNLPGSPAAARLCATYLAPLLEHGAAMSRGEGH
jgi:molybdenum cofactor synthesis domain-containing protein